MTLRERLANIFVGERNPETGRRDIGGAIREGVSGVGGRIGRGVAGYVNNRIHDRRYDRYMQGLYDQETRPDGLRPPPILGGEPSYAAPVGSTARPTVNGNAMTQAQLDRFRNDRRSILHRNAGQQNPMDPIERNPVSQFQDRSSRTRRISGQTAHDDSMNRAVAAIRRGSFSENIIQ